MNDETGQVRKVQKSFGSVFFKGQQPLEAYNQPFEAQTADKLATVVLVPTQLAGRISMIFRGFIRWV